MSPQANATSEPRRTILVVDDMPMFREIETVFLGRYGRVITANDGAEALVRARRERPDVVVTDLSMREMHGDQLCREIRADADLRRLPVVVVTGGSGEEHERAIRAGADDVVEKPLQRATLIQSVNRFLRLTVRGLVRAPLVTDVCLSASGEARWARSRNVSRGGIFVATESPLEPDTELELEFQVSKGEPPITPTARVVWRRPPGPDASELTPGMGLQFLKLDRHLAQRLEEYVYEVASPDMLAAVLPS